MSIYPVITKEKQKLYEEIYVLHTDLENNIPCICGYYGRACRNMNELANSALCNGCTLSRFVSTVEAVLECCDQKEALGIKHLYDTDIYDIQNSLKNKCVRTDYSYIEKIIDYLAGKQV